MQNEAKPVVGQIEKHFAGPRGSARYQDCIWNGSAWVPVNNAAPKPAWTPTARKGACHRCGTYCYGDCQS